MSPRINHVKSVLDLFQQDELSPGTASEYPLDLVPTGSPKTTSFLLAKAGGCPQRFLGGDYLLVPTYLTEATADSGEAAFSAMVAKLETDAAEILCLAAETAGTRGVPNSQELNVWSGRGKTFYVTPGDYCVMPVRRQAMTVRNPDGTYTCGMVAGLAVLHPHRIGWEDA